MAESSGEGRKCSNEIIDETLIKLQGTLNPDEIFLSEADLQFSFAQQLDKVLENKYGNNNYKIILEYPFQTKELYCENDKYDALYCNLLKKKMCSKCRSKCTDINSKVDGCFSDKSYEKIDLYFEYDNNKKTYIEFKYKTRNISKIKRGTSKEFTLKEHSNDTNQRQDVYKDIERIEHCLKWHKQNKVNDECYGYVIFLTNNKHHWDIKSKAKHCLSEKETKIIKPPDKPTERTCINTQVPHGISWRKFDFISKSEQQNDVFQILVIDFNKK